MSKVPKKRVVAKDVYKQRKQKLDKWARARNDAKSNVGEYKT